MAQIRIVGPVRGSSLTSIPHRLANGIEWSSVQSVFIAEGYSTAAGVTELLQSIPEQLPLSFVSGGGPLQTSVQAAQALLARGRSQTFLYFEPGQGLFHPKLVVMRRHGKGPVAVIGSSNATPGGLRNNIEVNVQVDLQISDGAGVAELATLQRRFMQQPAAMRVRPSNLAMLLAGGHLYDETTTPKTEDLLPGGFHPSASFGLGTSIPGEFAMTLSKNDVSATHLDGYFLVPTRARADEPGFWGWPDRYSGNPHLSRDIRILVTIPGQADVLVVGRIYYVEGKREFRVACPPVHQLGGGAGGWILICRWISADELQVSVVPPQDALYEGYFSRCTKIVSEQKRYAYV